MKKRELTYEIVNLTTVKDYGGEGSCFVYPYGCSPEKPDDRVPWIKVNFIALFPPNRLNYMG